MIKMLRIELNKIYKRKAVVVTIFIMLVINICYFLFFDYWWNDIYIINENAEVCSLKGNDAIKYDKMIGKYFKGILDDKKINEINKTLGDFKKKYSRYNEDQTFLLMNKFRNQIALIERINKQGTDLYGITIGYCTGWSKFVVSFSNVMTLSLGLILIVGISNIFAEEREAKMSYLIGASKFGRTKLVTAKFKAMYIYVLSNYTMFFFVNFLLYGFVYGFDGMKCDIQSSLIFVNSDYRISFGQLVVLMYFVGIVSCLALGSIILASSAVLKKNGPAILCSLLIIFAPLFFDMSSTLPLLQKILEVCPIYLLNIKEIFMNTVLYFGCKLHIFFGCLISIVSIVIIWVLIYKYMQKNEVWNF